MALGAAACGGSKGGEDAGGPGDADAAAWPLCEPGTYDGCLPNPEGDGDLPSVQARRCNAAGDAYEEITCVSEAGETVWCIDGACAACVPGSRTCKDEDTVQECSAQGEWVDALSCSAATVGDVCQSGVCVQLCEINRKLNSYIGCEYWAVDLDNAFVEAGNGAYYDAAGAPFAVVVGNPNQRFPAVVRVYYREGDEEREVLVDHDGNALDRSPVEPGTLRVLRLPRRDVEGTVLGRLAYRVESSIPTTVYQFNPLDNTNPVYSNDASLLLPTDVLGLEYLAMTREQTFASLRGFVTVVATEDDTAVEVTVTAPTLATGGFAALQPGEAVKVQMQRYDVLSLATDEPGADLTGTRVVADKKVAVFGGSEASNAPNTARCLPEGVCEWDGATPCDTLLDCVGQGFNTCCADHLEQQIFPLFVWGTRYVATQSFERGAAKDIWRVMAAEDGTTVATNPKQASIPVLNQGEWFEFESNEHFTIEANRPILVGQFLAAEDAPGPNSVPGADVSMDANIGDPAFILAVPVEQYREEYVVLAPAQYEFDYVNITAPSGAEVKLDGVALEASQFAPVSGEFRVARVRIEDGEHRIEASEPVGVIVYGFDSYVSYGYPGGLDLRDLGLITPSKPNR